MIDLPYAAALVALVLLVYAGARCLGSCGARPHERFGPIDAARENMRGGPDPRLFRTRARGGPDRGGSAVRRFTAEPFYDGVPVETLTRPWPAYTGTPPYGEWGAEPWAERWPGPSAPVDLGYA
jgi:hypothetical protein